AAVGAALAEVGAGEWVSAADGGIDAAAGEADGSVDGAPDGDPGPAELQAATSSSSARPGARRRVMPGLYLANVTVACRRRDD
ncbi:MAG TPA: hypothetical protein VF071_02445, partial [Candidatus Limnocylindria bacterium]